MWRKSQALQKFKENFAENGNPRILRSDNDTESTNKSFKQFCTNNNIKREYTVPRTPEQNGVAERYNPTAVETARSFLIESNMPKAYCRSCRHNSLRTQSCQKRQDWQKPLRKILGWKTKNRTFEKYWMSSFRQKSKTWKIKVWSKSAETRFPRPWQQQYCVSVARHWDS